MTFLSVEIKELMQSLLVAVFHLGFIFAEIPAGFLVCSARQIAPTKRVYKKSFDRY